jgi:hypothetical protein
MDVNRLKVYEFGMAAGRLVIAGALASAARTLL